MGATPISTGRWQDRINNKSNNSGKFSVLEKSVNHKPGKLVSKEILIPFILLTSCFAWWGLANNMTDTLLAAFKRIKSMSDLQTSFIQMAFYGAYFCFAIPAALYIRKFSYKSGVLLGLGLFITGGLLFYPASQTQAYTHFLIALYVLAGGLSILETSANPYIMQIGSRETATQRLNLAQSFNPIGSISGVLISKFFILSELQQLSAEERAGLPADELSAIQTAELNAVMSPYVVVSAVLLLTWLAIAFVRMPKARDEEKTSFKASLSRLMKDRNYVFGVVAQFFYVGAQIGVWSFTIRYVMQELGLTEEGAASWYIASLVLFAASRFICTALMSVVTPRKLLLILAAAAGVFSLGVIFLSGMAGVISLVLISGCMSLMFPTIYGLALGRVSGEDTKTGGSGLIMAILGGAILTAAQGGISDAMGISMSYLVPLACFIVVGLFAFNASKSPQHA